MKLRHFNIGEFDSPDCPGSGKHMHPATLEKLDRAREISGVRFLITSGFRTWKHHKKLYQKLGKKPTNSAHLRGRAADIAATTSRQRYTILEALLQVGFNRIGIGSTFIHADDDPALTPQVMWTYYE